MSEVVDEERMKQARRAVRLATRSAVYDTDLDGNPSRTDLKQALEEAAAAQYRALTDLAEHQAALAQNAALSPLGIPLSSASIGGASYSAADGASVIESSLRIPEAGGLCYAAYDILLDAGLFGTAVGVYG